MGISQEFETKRNANLTRNERIARQVVKIAAEREDGAVRPEKRKKKIALKTEEGKARQVEEIAVEKRERERRRSCPPRRKRD